MPFLPSVRKAMPMVAPFLVLMVVLTWYVQHNGFFWDSILLASKYGQWYYQTSFTIVFVPQEIAGYPPLFGMYMAAGWHVFGKSVEVSHWLMLPVLLGLVWQVYLLAKHYLPKNWPVWGLFLVFLDPTVLAQSAQVGPDVVLLFLYLLCLNSLLHHRNFWLVVGLIFLAVLSPRSQIALVAVFFTHLVIQWQALGKISLRDGVRIVLPYLPAVALLLGWQMGHYHHFGWIGFNRSSDWGTYSTLVTPFGFLRNLGLIAWRLLDFGRVALWLTAAILLWRFRKNIPWQAQQLLIMLLVPLLTLSCILVWFTNPIAHRYWLVVYVLLGLLTAFLLSQLTSQRLRGAMLGLLVLFLLSGHFWIYPATVAKGWDATLAHLPYFKLRQQMLHYLDQQQIPWHQVGSDFPNLAAPADTDLNHDPRTFPAKDLARQHYILHSNVFNGFTDQELRELEQDWQVQHEVRRGSVFFRLYRR
ncbi:MAG: hypothetical protein ACO1OQ_16520 [Rufibacter sp.]